MTMKAAIQEWDNKNAEDIEAVYMQFSGDNDFTENLIEFLPDKGLQRGTTWLIKRHFEQKGTLSEEKVSTLISSLNMMQHWEAQLHILQCLPYLVIPEKDSKRLHDFLLVAIKF
jgi:hypothetical protein